MQSEDIPGIRLLDGAFGTNFFGESKGCPEKEILADRPRAVALLRSYVRSGADAIYAPTFSANRPMLARFGLEGELEELNRELVKIAIEAAEGEAFVGGCISQTGLSLVGDERVSKPELIEIFSEQARALALAGADFIVIETMQQLGEARCALLAAKSATSLPVFVTMSVDNDGRTTSGSSALCCLAVLQSMGADAFGLNCCEGISAMPKLISELSPYAKIPLIAKPSAGVGKKFSPEEFADFAYALLEAGADILGGCCGTDSSYTAQLRKAMTKARIKGFTRPEKDEESIIAATEFDAVFIDPTIDISEPYDITENLAEVILEAEEEPCSALKLRSTDTVDTETFTENAYMLNMPLCIDAANPGLFDRLALEYNGRALFDHVGELDIDEISGIIDKYGIIVL